MLLVALTGGIGSGKSAVGAMLAAHGAIVVDADDLARRAVEPGSPGMVKVLDYFGPDVVRPDGSLDRQGLASRVFADPGARRALETIVHPEVARLFAQEVDAHRDTDDVVVYVVPLLAETGLAPAFDVVVTVSAPEDVRAARLAADRGMAPGEVLARMEAQAADDEREAIADVVIANAGSLTDLQRDVDALWADLQSREPGGRGRRAGGGP